MNGVRIQATDWRPFSLKSSHRGRLEASIICEKCGVSSGGRRPGWYFKRTPSTLGFAGRTVYRCDAKACKPVAQIRPCRRCSKPRISGMAFCSTTCADIWLAEIA